ncbi:type I glyceraldehyde-3-phosphate dehydrogenase [Candidatus Pacearchaeota archaeon]|nr:type I glyceraldehyde-3-phosphate dehydrogenase [Candidatus Pacearchaeota archaeon]|tara:strand:+ start:5323 stop:6300 length:978 start_codon:yes stop_codon:yes gene_type:complete
MRVAINGFGRIGRAVFKAAIERGINVVAINNPHGAEDSEYLLKYDSVYGRYDKKVESGKDFIKINGKKVIVIGERDVAKLPWKKLKIDVVVDATGAFRDGESLSGHLKAGAKRVIVTAPSKGVDIVVVPGVNADKLRASHKIISVASCTTNALAPVTKILDDAFKIKSELMTTIHAYTDSQKLLGGSHKKRRRGRAAALNLIPTTTGASVAVESVLPKLKGDISGLAVRVPVAIVSLVDVVAEVKKPVSVDKVKSVFKKSARGQYKGIVGYTEEDLVSSDFVGDTRSAIVDGQSIQVKGDLVKVLAWYDNEFGYSNRVVDVVGKL